MRIGRALLAMCVTVGTLSVATAAPALADERVCRGTIGARSIDEDIRVPRGATCRLTNTRVDGNVKVSGNAKLYVRGAVIGGNIQAERAHTVDVRRSTQRNTRVDGDIQVEDGRRIIAHRVRVDGNIQVEDQRGLIDIRRNTVEGDIQVFSNDSRAYIYRNVVDGNLQCKSNSPRPVGDHNRVSGNKEDQCRGF